MQSFRSRLMPLVMTVRGSKRKYESAELTLADVAKHQAAAPVVVPPKAINKLVDVTVSTINGWQVYRLSPRSSTPSRRVLYLHGGTYVYEISPQHWTLCADLAMRTGACVVLPIYPLPPHGTASTVVPVAIGLAEGLIAEVGADNVTVMGDSAGGGMALAVAMGLRDNGVPAPHATILISPWLDISGTDPELARIAPRDPWLAVPGSVAAGALYRAELAVDDWRVSPIHGDLSGLGSIQMFSGTRDILNADAHRLLERAALIGLPIEYHEAPEMIHVYPLLPIPEAKPARELMARAILG